MYLTGKTKSSNLSITMYGIKIISSSENHNNYQLNSAKKFPIEKLYQGKLRRTGKVMMGLCPFKEENTPSFAIYPENNTWHCFSCGLSGDSISFYMYQNDCDFITAIKELNET
jgi:hypothetical protein